VVIAGNLVILELEHLDTLERPVTVGKSEPLDILETVLPDIVERLDILEIAVTLE
jgi:hypothetical protein